MGNSRNDKGADGRASEAKDIDVGAAVSWTGQHDPAHSSEYAGVVLGKVATKDRGSYYIIEADSGHVLAVPERRVSRRLSGDVCKFLVVDREYGGAKDLASGITGCKVGVVVWSGDIEAWTKMPGRYHCAHCGRKVEVGS